MVQLIRTGDRIFELEINTVELVTRKRIWKADGSGIDFDERRRNGCHVCQRELLGQSSGLVHFETSFVVRAESTHAQGSNAALSARAYIRIGPPICNMSWSTWLRYIRLVTTALCKFSIHLTISNLCRQIVFTHSRDPANKLFIVLLAFVHLSIPLYKQSFIFYFNFSALNFINHRVCIYFSHDTILNTNKKLFAPTRKFKSLFNVCQREINVQLLRHIFSSFYLFYIFIFYTCETTLTKRYCKECNLITKRTTYIVQKLQLNLYSVQRNCIYHKIVWRVLTIVKLTCKLGDPL